jgi:hypothetical protein
MDLRPGWLSRQFEANAIEIATWPESMRASAGFTDEGMTERQRKEAARILRKRADELDPPTEVPAKDAGPSDSEMLDCLHEHRSKINQIEPPEAFPDPDLKWVIFLDGYGDFIFTGKTFRDAARAFFAAMKEQGR